MLHIRRIRGIQLPNWLVPNCAFGKTFYVTSAALSCIFVTRWLASPICGSAVIDGSVRYCPLSCLSPQGVTFIIGYFECVSSFICRRKSAFAELVCVLHMSTGQCPSGCKVFTWYACFVSLLSNNILWVAIFTRRSSLQCTRCPLKNYFGPSALFWVKVRSDKTLSTQVVFRFLPSAAAVFLRYVRQKCPHHKRLQRHSTISW